jgi:hypothetical protein
VTEVEVLLRTHRFLREEGLGQRAVSRLFTDAHHTLLPHRALAPFQRFSLTLGDVVAHPDLVGQLDDGETLVAVEAKGSTDLLRGLAQAEWYQQGFHLAFFAAEATALGDPMVNFARRKNVGVVPVGDEVRVAHLPAAQLPLREAARPIADQFETVVQLISPQAFVYNLPTHYLAWAIALAPEAVYRRDELPAYVMDYPMPANWRAALGGAQKLGLVAVHGPEVGLTPAGAAVRELLPPDLAMWAAIHRQIASRGGGISLQQVAPQAAAALRLLLLQDPLVRLVIEGLRQHPGGKADFAQLARTCDRLEHARAPVLFLQPAAIERLADARSAIAWERAGGADYRSTTYSQYKSILKHAGILTNTGLGGSSSRAYDPSRDLWLLRR